jgi:hypothetical protein
MGSLMSNPIEDSVFTVYDKTGDEYTVFRSVGGFQLEDGTPVEHLDDVNFLIKSIPPIEVSVEHYIDTELDEEY